MLLVDGGSGDSTLAIGRRFNVKLLTNRLRTGEAGKAVGIKQAGNQVILLQDSDNVLDRPDWLLRMVEPFADPSIAGAEPLYYSYRREDSTITRYCALIGMNDPICLYLGNYDRFSLVTGKWTGLPIKAVDYGDFIVALLTENFVPTIGANGFMVRTSDAKDILAGSYAFDIDMIHQLVHRGRNRFAKVKIGILHLFADNASMFVRKTHRRVRDYLYYRKYGMRAYPWLESNRLRIPLFAIYALTILVTARDSIRGYRKRPDGAWFFHPIACWLTLLVYGLGLLRTGLCQN